MRVLITGASGFAGGVLARACAAAGDEVLGVSRSGGLPGDGGRALALDLCDAGAVGRTVSAFQPEVIYHLAALSSVGRSWEAPAKTMRDNVLAAVSVLEAVRTRVTTARLIWVSTCEVYGTPAELPIPETSPVAPTSPYAVSKAAGDQLAGVYAEAYGLHIVRARAFSHTGPGQRPIFIVSNLVRTAAESRARGERRIELITGNPDTRRDFTDVRDVVRAYRLLAERAGPGVYNVSSGTSVSATEHVRLLAELLAPIEVHHVVDPARVRPHEVMDLRGANDRLRAATGWQPEIPLRQTMLDMLDWWEGRLRMRH
ncbi:MAG: GDP-mannose 4,6-dehydratase [Solirubrobacteraceae bacterium]